MLHFVSSGADFERCMNALVFALLFPQIRRSQTADKAHWYFNICLTFQISSVEHFMNQAVGTFSLYHSSNNRSQLHGLHAPLRRFRVSFVFQVQRIINKFKKKGGGQFNNDLVL